MKIRRSASSSARERFALRLRLLRQAAGLTQEQLAERAELTAKYIGQLERNEACPSLRVIEQLAAALDMPIHELLRLDDPRPVAALAPEDVAAMRGAVDRLDSIVRRLEAILSAT